MGTDQRDVYKQSNWPCNRLRSDRGDLFSCHAGLDGPERRGGVCVLWLAVAWLLQSL